jgi:hypothetical protein
LASFVPLQLLLAVLAIIVRSVEGTLILTPHVVKQVIFFARTGFATLHGGCELKNCPRGRNSPNAVENNLILADPVPDVGSDFGQWILAWQSETCPNPVSKVASDIGNRVSQN